MTLLLQIGALVLIVLALGVTVYTLGANPPSDAPELGRRGLKRARALKESALLAFIEPWMRLVAGWIAYLPITKTRRRLDLQIRHAGDWLGMTPDEVLGLSVLSAIASSAIGLFLTDQAGLPPEFSLFFALVGASLPLSRLSGEVRDRFKTIARTLPGAIDLAAMCMAAGLDFPGSLRQIVDKTPTRNAPLREEFEYILQELELGRTRRQALEAFADRVPSEAVRDFVGAVVQSEEKGNPLAQILRVQANMLRMRRTVLAEEAATRAGIKMMAPLMCIFIAIMILLIGPSILKLMNSGL